MKIWHTTTLVGPMQGQEFRPARFEAERNTPSTALWKSDNAELPKVAFLV
jgi:hypothetical protein